MRFIVGLVSGGSAESSCLMRLDGVGDESSSSAFRFAAKNTYHVSAIGSVVWATRDILSSDMAAVMQRQIALSRSNVWL